MIRILRTQDIALWLVLIGVFAVATAVAENASTQAVKKSGSGVCHCLGGQFYDRTSNYTPFETIDACLASGGREPKRGQGDCSQGMSNNVGDPNADTDSNVVAGVVKKSDSGICHCPGGQFYDRTSNYTPFETIDACLASGGRKPKRGQGDCRTLSSQDQRSTLSPSSYDRSVFGGWIDDDGNCQNTRHERLIARSVEPVKLSQDGCEVVRGRWNDPYTGSTYTLARELEIDHVVPLSYAWERGASQWDPKKQRRFANDPANLLPVGMTINRSKGAAGPLEWLPTAANFVCEYLLRFSRVTTRYKLALSPEENAALAQLTSQQCD